MECSTVPAITLAQISPLAEYDLMKLVGWVSE